MTKFNLQGTIANEKRIVSNMADNYQWDKDKILFSLNLIDTKLQEVRDEINSFRIPSIARHLSLSESWVDGYNQAISDVLNLIG